LVFVGEVRVIAGGADGDAACCSPAALEIGLLLASPVLDAALIRMQWRPMAT
jgi:hypothetical protein